MLTEKDYCDYDTCVALNELGLSFEDASQRFERNILTNIYEEVPRPLLYEAQKWLMTQGIYIAPRIYLYHDINLDDETSWECNIYIAYAAIYTVGKSLSYEDALLLGIKEGINKLRELHERRRQKLEMENTEFDYGHNINHKEIN